MPRIMMPQRKPTGPRYGVRSLPYNGKPWSNPIRYKLAVAGRDFCSYSGRTALDRSVSNRGFATPASSIYVPGGGQPVEVSFDTQGAALYWPAPSGDFEIVLEFAGYANRSSEMVGPFIVDSTGAGIGASVYNNPVNAFVWVLSSWAYSATGPSASWTMADDQRHLWIALRRSGTAYSVRSSNDGATWTSSSSTQTSTITPAWIGIGRFYQGLPPWYRLYRLNVFGGPTYFPG